MRRTVLPAKKDLVDATLEVLTEVGGTVSTKTINRLVAEKLQISEETLMIEDENGCGTAYEYRMRWIRTELKQKKIIANPKRGEWKLA